MFEPERLNPTARLLLDRVVQWDPAWGLLAHNYDEGGALPGCVSFEVPSPAHEGRHCLRLTLRGDTMEIAYDDAEPPGSAETQYILPEFEEKEAIEAALGFVSDIVNDRIVVGRERLPVLCRLLRRDCVSIARFFRREEIAGWRRRRLERIISWTGAADWEPRPT